MKKVALVFAFCGCTLSAFRLNAQKGIRAEVIVSTTGTVRTVERALQLVRPGGRVIITAGTYREPMIVVTGPVMITGRGAVILDGSNSHQIMSISGNDVTVRGLILRNVGSSYREDRAALKITGAARCVIENNSIENGFFGIYLASVRDCRISNNHLSAHNIGESGSGNGIHLWSSRDIVIEKNSISGYRDGIYFEFVRGTRVSGNSSNGNLRYGLHFMYSDSCVYLDNSFSRNLAGVAVMYTKHIEMRRNVFADNWGPTSYGLLLKEISDPVIQGNHFVRNTIALVADGAVRIKAVDNDFDDNGTALRLMASTYSGEFRGNNFTGNTFDVQTDTDDGSNQFAGNYFDNYRGYDLNRDGRGDIPFHPVRLFSKIAANNPPTMILLRSFFMDILDAAERVLPSLTPDAVVDSVPSFKRVGRS